MKNLEKKYVNIAFIVSLIILAAVNIFTYINIRFHLDDEALVNEAIYEIQLSEVLLAKISESETNRNAYLITYEKVFLDRYYSSVKSADSLLAILIKEVKQEHGKVYIDSIGSILLLRKDILAEYSQLQDSKNKVNRFQFDNTMIGHDTQDKIRELINKYKKIERDNINQRLKDSDISASYTLIYLPVGSLIAYILLLTGLIILNRNISKQRQTENSLWESRNWFATTLKNIDDGVIVASNIGDIVYLNKVAEQLTGWNENEANGLLLEHVLNIYDEKTVEKYIDFHKSPVYNNITGKIIGNLLLKTKSNKFIPIEYSASRLTLDGDKSQGTVYVFRDITERRKTENEILDSKKFIQRIADSIPSIIYTYSLKGLKLNYVNYKILDLLGYSSQYIISLGEGFFKKLIHPQDTVKLLSLYQRFANAKDSEILDYEYRILNSLGQWRNFKSFDVVFSRHEDGTVSEMLGTAMDITEQKKLEEEIKQYSGQLEELVANRTKELQKTNDRMVREISERIKAENSIMEAETKFRSLVENTQIGIYIIQDFNYVYINPKYEELFGFESGELIGKNSLDRVHPDYVNMVKENMLRRLNNEIESVQYVIKGIKKDGSIIDVEVRGTIMMDNNKKSIIGTLMDITERKMFEEALIDQQQFLNTVIDTDPSFVFAKDWNGKFTLVNKAVAENYGTSVNELIGKTDADFNKNQDEVIHFLNDDREVITTGKPKFISEEVVTNTKTGESKWYQTIKVPLHTKDENTQVLGVATDITARKLAEGLTIKSLQEKELLLKEIHHRVKNNLQIIVSLLKLQANYMFDQRDIELFTNSRTRVETMSMIHEKLYKTEDISNIDLGNYLTDLARNILKSDRNKYNGISLDINSEKILMGIDTAIPCGLIINELLLCIIKHSFDETSGNCIKMDLCKTGDVIKINVRDNGKGISPVLNVISIDSLGKQLIDMLVKQIDGYMNLTNDNGTCFELTFCEITYKERI